MRDALGLISKELGKDAKPQMGVLDDNEVTHYRGSENTTADIKYMLDWQLNEIPYASWGQGLYITPDEQEAAIYGKPTRLKLDSTAKIIVGEEEWSEGERWLGITTSEPYQSSKVVDFSKIKYDLSGADLVNLYWASQGYDGAFVQGDEVVLFNGSKLTIDSTDALEKVSFGGDRSEAGRYAANMRWKNNAQNKGTGFLGEPANIGVLELTRGEAMFVEDTEAVIKADMTLDNGNDGLANRPDVAAKRTVLKGILAGMSDVSQEDFEAADAALGGFYLVKEKVKEELVQHLIDTWASTSNDHNPASLMIQQVVSKTFGLTDTLEMADMNSVVDGDYEDRKAEDKLKANPALERVLTAFVKAQYANTQAYLANKGITEVALQRGMDSEPIREALRDFRMAHFERMIENGEIELKDSFEGENRNDDIAGNIDDDEFEETVPVGFLNARIKMRPLSSFTTKPFIADSFAMDVDDGVVFTMTVPAKQIFSMPFTGVGCLREREMVVLGGKQKAQFAENSNYDQDLDYDDMFRPSDPDRAQDF
jgi:hypothetical protein